MKRMLTGLGLAAVLALLVPSGAEAQMEGMKAPEGKEYTVTGTVIDLSCKFRHGLTGAEHRMCAQVCADKGVPLAILSSDGTLYVPVSADMPGGDESMRLKEYAEQGVTVSGLVFKAGGAMAIQIENIERT
jgi:hypothetical protein